MQTKILKQNYTILAIDTSCDETSVAVTQDDRVFANVIASQIDLHRKWGGVVPDIAKRAHQQNINPAVKEALKRANIELTSKSEGAIGQSRLQKRREIDAIAVTQGPGLAIALEVGIQKAKELAQKYHKPLIAVNHMEGHLLSPLIKNSRGKGNEISNVKFLSFGNTQDKISKQNTNIKYQTSKIFPILGLLVSGGHTELIIVHKIGKYEKIGQTVDDAAGEAFDKLAKMLDLGYPGGEIVEEFAKKGDAQKFELPRPMAKSEDLNYSFSGLKTAALYLIKELKARENHDFLARHTVFDLCASFQQAVIDSLTIKLNKAIDNYKPKFIFCGGGVMANLALRKAIRKNVRCKGIPVLFPANKKLYTDNAAMIGVAGYYKALRNEFWKGKLAELDRKPGLSL